MIGQHICTFLSKKTLVLRRRRKHGFLNIQTPASGPACITGMQLCKRRRSIDTFVNDQYYEIIWYHQIRQFRQQQFYGDRCLMCTMPGRHNLRSFLAENSTQNYFLIARMFSFCDIRDKNAVFNILRQNVTIFVISNE